MERAAFIFCSEVGTPIGPLYLNRQFAAVLVKAELPTIPLHCYRHSCATLLGGMGVADCVSGHTPAMMTGRYAHATLAAIHQAVEDVERVVFTKAA